LRLFSSKVEPDDTGCDMDERMEDGRTGLHVAWMLGRAGSVRELIEAGAEVRAKDEKRRTFMYWATAASAGGYLEVLRYIAETCGEELLREKDEFDRTCALWASAGGQLEVLRYL
ncbi:hypothetical protein GUITHDRAFT_40883, partial [Guillardia theta CCMP2712]